MPPLPMFPIGSVLFPRGVLPLQVFEPRYRALVSDVLAADGRFGVVLIERGSDVGGGDVRSGIGTLAQIAEKGVLDDDRIILLNAGIERLRVTQWLEDDPYPRADVEAYPDAPSRGLRSAVERAAAARRRLAALAVEMGAENTDLEVELPDDVVAAAWDLCVMAPLGPFDQQKLLEANDPVIRMRLLEEMLENDRRDLEEIMRRGSSS